jgi:hypothetical protein
MHSGCDALDGIHGCGDYIAAGSADQRQRRIAVDFYTDTGVDPDGADVGTVAAVAGDQVDLTHLAVEHCVQIPEESGVCPEHPAEVISGSYRERTDGDTRQKCSTADTLVEGSVSAAGIDPERFSGGSLQADFFGGIAGGFGDIELPGICTMVKSPLYAPEEVSGGIPASGDGIDDEQMLHDPVPSCNNLNELQGYPIRLLSSCYLKYMKRSHLIIPL